MIIREEQFHDLSQQRFKNFSCRLIAHLRKCHRDRLAPCSDSLLDRYIRESADRAKRLYGLATEQAIACYSELPFVLHDEFEIDENYQAIPALLGKKSFNPSTRAKMALSLAYRVKAAMKNAR